MAFGIGRGLATPLLVINFALYLIAACLAGWALNRNFDAQNRVGEGAVGDNNVTTYFLPLALIACMVGLASVLAGTHHIRVWRGDSLAAAAATSLVAWLLTLLAMGLAAKEIHSNAGYRPRRLKVLEAFIIILSLFELLYLLSLHAGFLSGGSAAGYNQSGAGYNQGGAGHHHHHHGANVGGHNHEHHVDYGHHTEMKIPQGHVEHPVV